MCVYKVGKIILFIIFRIKVCIESTIWRRLEVREELIAKADLFREELCFCVLPIDRVWSARKNPL